MKNKIFWIAVVFAILLNIIFTVSYPHGWWNALNFLAIGTIVWCYVDWEAFWAKIKMVVNSEK